jgi:hypothetical protein
MRKELVRHVIHIEPIFEQVSAHLPPEFISQLGFGTSAKYQNRAFSAWITPLNYREYKQYNTARYHMNTLMDIFNKHVELPKEISLAYVLKWPLLVKTVVDAIFDISSDYTDRINADPKIMFSDLRRRREELSRNDALLDRFVMINGGFEFYTAYRTIETMEERLDIVAAMELITNVSIEQRYEFATKRGMAIKLAPDREFEREYKHHMAAGGKSPEFQQLFDESERSLSEAMLRERRNAELGIKTRVNTKSENNALEEL